MMISIFQLAVDAEKPVHGYFGRFSGRKWRHDGATRESATGYGRFGSVRDLPIYRFFFSTYHFFKRLLKFLNRSRLLSENSSQNCQPPEFSKSTKWPSLRKIPLCRRRGTGLMTAENGTPSSRVTSNYSSIKRWAVEAFL